MIVQSLNYTLKMSVDLTKRLCEFIKFFTLEVVLILQQWNKKKFTEESVNRSLISDIKPILTEFQALQRNCYSQGYQIETNDDLTKTGNSRLLFVSCLR